MHVFLEHDADAGGLRLIMADYYAGQHERTAFDVVNADGAPVRRRPELDGAPVYGSAHAGWFIRAPHGGQIPVWTRAGQRAETLRTVCPRADNRRRRCAACAADGVLVG